MTGPPPQASSMSRLPAPLLTRSDMVAQNIVETYPRIDEAVGCLSTAPPPTSAITSNERQRRPTVWSSTSCLKDTPKSADPIPILTLLQIPQVYLVGHDDFARRGQKIPKLQVEPAWV